MWRRLASVVVLAVLGVAMAAGFGTRRADATPLPPPYATPNAVRHPVTVGWPPDRTPTAPNGFTVARWATGLDYPRWMLVLPNGDVLVSEARTLPKKTGKEDAQMASRAMGPSANRITLLRDADRDGRAETRHTLRQGLSQPFGMALVGAARGEAADPALCKVRTRIALRGMPC